ncbi:hypothetical protein [Kitasatospora sp. NPDC057198]|uniref:hypothetical protein n=1 Tax=Kitasatospora sp. NPDC057198 TaxID=3346046 RepID=UPI003637C5E5
MPDDGSGVDESLVAAARERLRAGAAPSAVCGKLAARTPRWSEAAVAVGVARGTAEAELRERLAGYEQAQDEFHPGEEEDYGHLLEMCGVFDVPERLDEREEEIAGHLRAAWDAMGGLGSGYAISLSRRFVKGELSSAFRMLARFGPRQDRGRPAEFWAAMVAAGELLDSADGDERETVARVLAESRRHLAEATR